MLPDSVETARQLIGETDDRQRAHIFVSNMEPRTSPEERGTYTIGVILELLGVIDEWVSTTAENDTNQ